MFTPPQCLLGVDSLMGLAATQLGRMITASAKTWSTGLLLKRKLVV